MSETVFTSAQVAKLLGVSGGMVRRYALNYEQITKQVIPKHPRNGRQFSQHHVDTLLSARRFVAGRQGLSIETGLKLALGLADLPPADALAIAMGIQGLVDLEALETALSEYVRPLLTQLQAVSKSNAKLSHELEQIRLELATQKSAEKVKWLPSTAYYMQEVEPGHGPFFQAALWIDRVVGRKQRLTS